MLWVIRSLLESSLGFLNDLEGEMGLELYYLTGFLYREAMSSNSEVEEGTG